MSVNVQGLRSAADYMRQTTGIDPEWLREAANEIDHLRRENAHLKDLVEGYKKLAKST